jgi:hypothetical protein
MDLQADITGWVGRYHKHLLTKARDLRSLHETLDSYVSVAGVDVSLLEKRISDLDGAWAAKEKELLVEFTKLRVTYKHVSDVKFKEEYDVALAKIKNKHDLGSSTSPT